MLLGYSNIYCRLCGECEQVGIDLKMNINLCSACKLIAFDNQYILHSSSAFFVLCSPDFECAYVCKIVLKCFTCRSRLR
jgi:hypothetical protein